MSVRRRVSRLREEDRVVVRTQSGRFTKLNRSKKQVFEVFRKNKQGVWKSAGFLNLLDRKTKKPIPRRFTRSQIDVLRQTEPREVVKISRRGLRFPIFSNQPVSGQVYTHAKTIIREFRRAHKSFEEFLAEVLVTDPAQDFTNIGGGTILIRQNERLNSTRVLSFIIDAILRALSRVGRRMSPKKLARHPSKKHIRKVWVSIEFSV